VLVGSRLYGDTVFAFPWVEETIVVVAVLEWRPLRASARVQLTGTFVEPRAERLRKRLTKWNLNGEFGYDRVGVL
jgi:hypothetical protein